LFSFAHIEYLLLLLLLLPVIGLYYAHLKWKQKAANKLGDPALIRLLTVNHAPQKFTRKFWLLAAAFSLVVLGAANLRKAGASQNVVRKGRDVVFALDVSKSMLAEDVQPSRLEKAKQFISKVIDNLPDDRIALIWFAGKAYLPMPLTADNGAAKLFVQSASPAAVPTQGTVIGQALQLAAQSFPEDSKRHKVVVLITDGEDHDETAVETATLLKEQGILLLVIGLGTGEGATILEPGMSEVKKDQLGQTVVSKLNEPLLRQLAQADGGMYGNLNNTDAMVKDVAAIMGQLEKKGVGEAAATTNYSFYFYWFLAVALIVLILEIFITERKNK
jgi:Ca-activated chloride channel family protein